MTPDGRTPPPGARLDPAGRRVTVVGLGRFGGGAGVTRWLAEQGAIVTVTDQAPPEQLGDSIRQLEGLQVALHLGGHDERDFLQAELLVLNPAVRPDHPLAGAASAAGVPITTEINLFLHRCPARIVGITGSVGKSTTTAMVGEVLSRRFTTHVGGNIGRSLLAALPTIASDHIVVLELSSFQLHRLPEIGRSPQVAVVTNLTANHLDWHGTMDAYADAKKNIFRFQGPEGVLVLNATDGPTARWADEAPGRVEWFDPAGGEPFDLAVVGKHNQADAQAAWAAARAMGVGRAAAAAALRAFAGLPHRLQFVGEHGGVRYYNDSKCTTPEGAIVALDAFEPRRAVFIVGGYDKGATFAALGQALAARAKAVVLLGATAGKIRQAVRAACPGDVLAIDQARDLAEAVGLARARAETGDAVVLSPACASYDQFVNYEQRGNLFVKLATEPA